MAPRAESKITNTTTRRELNMAPTTRVKASDGKKPTSNVKAPAPAFGPSRQLNRTPPPTARPRIVGTPLTSEINQPKPTTTSNASSPPTQQCEEKTAIQKAQDALSIALSCLQDSYQSATKKVK